jgi:hypothetical protein
MSAEIGVGLSGAVLIAEVFLEKIRQIGAERQGLRVRRIRLHGADLPKWSRF